jgi:nucleoside-diphosphate kinase
VLTLTANADADLAEKPFFPGLIKCMSLKSLNYGALGLNNTQDMLSGPICAMVWEGRDAVKTGRSEFSILIPTASSMNPMI